MIASKLAKAFILGLCITVFSSTAAFAESVGGQTAVNLTQPASYPNQSAAGQQTAGQGQAAEGHMAVSPSGTVVIDSRLLEKQTEIDRYLFEKHVKDIAGKGFTVTNTGVTGDYVEIGITPYSEENAEYLYGIFGKDMVKVVEGQQAVLMGSAAGAAGAPAAGAAGAPDTAVSSPAQAAPAAQAADGKMSIQTAPLDAKVGSANGAGICTVAAAAEAKGASGMASPVMIALAFAAGVVVIGGTAILARRRRIASR